MCNVVGACVCVLCVVSVKKKKINSASSLLHMCTFLAAVTSRNINFTLLKGGVCMRVLLQVPLLKVVVVVLFFFTNFYRKDGHTLCQWHPEAALDTLSRCTFFFWWFCSLTRLSDVLLMCCVVRVSGSFRSSFAFLIIYHFLFVGYFFF